MALSGDKTKLLQDMKTSFSSLKFAVLQLNDADADRPQDIFNRHTTLRGAFTMITGHFLASTSANLSDARVNGVVPPWTEEAQQQQQKPADKPKP
jgi:hypothetical protein